MSYQQFLHDVHSSMSGFPHGRAVQHWITMNNRACRFLGDYKSVIQDEPEVPDHRFDEFLPGPDDRWDPPIDECIPTPLDRPQWDDWGMRVPPGSVRRIDAEDLVKVGRRVFGRHDAVVTKIWFRTPEFLTKQLQDCSFADALRLQEALGLLEPTEAVIRQVIAECKALSTGLCLTYYEAVAASMKALDTSDDDAAVHAADGFAHNLPPRETGSHDFNPEWLMLLQEGVPSAAMIAHKLHISLAAAGDVREAIILQEFEQAHQVIEEHIVHDEEDEAAESLLDDPPEEPDDADVPAFVSAGWHIMDDIDDVPEDRWPWYEQQPARFKVLLHQAANATSLARLKQLGQKVYNLPQDAWTPAQRGAFWAFWKARRQHILTQTLQRFKRVRKAVARLQQAKAVELPRIGYKLTQLQKDQPGFYPEEG